MAANKLRLITDDGQQMIPFSYLYDVHTEAGIIWVQFCNSTDWDSVRDLHIKIEAKGKVHILCVDKCCEKLKEILKVHPGCQVKEYKFFP